MTVRTGQAGGRRLDRMDDRFVDFDRILARGREGGDPDNLRLVRTGGHGPGDVVCNPARGQGLDQSTGGFNGLEAGPGGAGLWGQVRSAPFFAAAPRGALALDARGAKGPPVNDYRV